MLRAPGEAAFLSFGPSWLEPASNLRTPLRISTLLLPTLLKEWEEGEGWGAGQGRTEECSSKVQGCPLSHNLSQAREPGPAGARLPSVLPRILEKQGHEHLLLHDLPQERELETAAHTFLRGLPQPPALLEK